MLSTAVSFTVLVTTLMLPVVLGRMRRRWAYTFGACLMKSPRLVAECVSAMRAVTPLPVTVKTRIGVDDRDDYEFVRDFVGVVAAAGCDTFVIHARKAYLAGLSPKENRTIPPLRHDIVYQLRRDFPGLELIINGGIETEAGIRQQLAAGLDGVMIGRKAYADPWWLTEVDRLFLADGATTPLTTRLSTSPVAPA